MFDNEGASPLLDTKQSFLLKCANGVSYGVPVDTIFESTLDVVRKFFAWPKSARRDSFFDVRPNKFPALSLIHRSNGPCFRLRPDTPSVFNVLETILLTARFRSVTDLSVIRPMNPQIPHTASPLMRAKPAPRRSGRRLAGTSR